jgi:hypothetical protein
MFDTIKRLGAVSEDNDELRRHIFSTYFWLRRGMLLIALAFPPLLIIGGLLHSVPFQGSMSAYYWAPPTPEGGDPPMRVWFVGILFALGSCLFLYKGYTRLEDWLLNGAAVCAICVALFPMCWDRWSECPSFSWHGFFAIVFFVLLALVAVYHWLYTLGCFQRGSRLLECFRGGWRRLLSGYSGCYLATAAGMVVFPLVTWILFETNGAQIFLVEFAGIVAFCLFWGVQILQIRRSQFDQKLAQSESAEEPQSEEGILMDEEQHKKPAPPDIEEEYPAVRAEILQWQNYRFLTLAASGAVVSAFLTIVFASVSRDSSSGTNTTTEIFGDWAVLAPSSLLLFLGCAVALTLYAGRGNAKMGTYLMVFYQQRGAVSARLKRGVGWESRHNDFKGKFKNANAPMSERLFEEYLTLDRLLAGFYLILGLGSVYLLYTILYFQWRSLVLLIALLVYGIPLLLLLVRRPPSGDYMECWKQIKKEEKEEERKAGLSAKTAR